MKSVTYILKIVLLALTVSTVKSQQPINDYIRSKIVIYYYANPNAQSLTPYPRISDSTLAQFARGTSTLFGGNPGMNRIQTLIGNMVKPTSQGGDQNLQYFVSKILKIRDNTIAIFVYNDSANLNANALSLNGCTQNELNSSGATVRQYYWPCANNISGSGYSGYVNLGRHYFDLTASSPSSQQAVFMHEFFHTQDMSDPQFHKYFIGGNYYHYGTDGIHYFHEAVPSIGMAYKEGIADALTLIFDYSIRNRYFRWFDDNGQMLVERAAVSPLNIASGASPDIWLYTLLSNAGVTFTTDARFPNYGLVNIRSLPPRYLMYNELIVGMICSYYIELISLNKFLSSVAIRNAVSNSSSDFGELINEMCILGLPPYLPLSTFSNSTPAFDPNVEHMYLLPLAYADYFTGWRSANANEFAGMLNNKVDRGLLDYYYSSFHDELRSAFPLPASSTSGHSSYSNMVEIAMRFGVRTSDPER